jgi:Ca2+-binding RTX toxin-like protein
MSTLFDSSRFSRERTIICAGSVVLITLTYVLLTAGSASAAATCGGLAPTINASNANNVIKGTVNQDIIMGNGGSDTIVGFGGDDIICGGDGNDTIRSGSGDDEVYGGNGDDTINTASGDDLVYGDAGTDTIKTKSGDDEIDPGSAGYAPDAVFGGDGSDQLSGNSDYVNAYLGGGGDVADISGSALQVYGGPGDDELALTATVSSFAYLYGNAGSDYLSGDGGSYTGNSYLWGGLGDDHLSFGYSCLGGDDFGESNPGDRFYACYYAN